MFSIQALVRFRILFGLVLCFGLLSSIAKGEIALRYTEPTFFFPYFGFSWLPYIGDAWILPLHILLIICSLAISVGFCYRAAVAIFFIGFGYLHFLDSTNYINHYYLVLLLLGLLFFVPANKCFSVDLFLGRVEEEAQINAIWYRLLQFQIAVVYFFAGVAKLNSDWLFSAMPLRIWFLQAASNPLIASLPFVGDLLALRETAFVAAWAAAAYDLTIWAWLLWRPTRRVAFAAVIGFHFFTALLFDIGLFPYLMPIAGLLFFAEADKGAAQKQQAESEAAETKATKRILYFAAPYILLQILLPLRGYFLYSGNILWHEEGYRWSWRVMLVEKEGVATFWVTDSASGQTEIVDNAAFLSPFQQKRLIQPEHILLFAQYLSRYYAETKGWHAPKVQADVRITLNARRSRPLVDTSVNLAAEPWSLAQKTWLLPLE
jgi:hypothetical protein